MKVSWSGITRDMASRPVPGEIIDFGLLEVPSGALDKSAKSHRILRYEFAASFVDTDGVADRYRVDGVPVIAGGQSR